MMKKTIIIFILVASLPLAHAGEYVKANAGLSLFPKNGTAEFRINASYGSASGVCNMEGIAESIGAKKQQKNRWAYSDPSSMCVAIISEWENGTADVITRDCESYCGLSAVGSMDGKYRKE